MITRSSFKENNENNLPKSKPAITRSRTFGTDLTNSVKLEQEKPVTPIEEYTSDIYNYLHSVEENFMPSAGYMLTQDNINEKMRGILIDWLIEVHLKFKLIDETLFLTVNIIDRYLSKNKVEKELLQLIGVSSMLIACKYEEIYPPEINDFVYVTDNSYSAEQVLEYENKILRSLDFDVTVPSSFRFLQRYCGVCEFDEIAFNFARFVLELTLAQYRFIKFRPSNLAASAVYVTQKALKIHLRSLTEHTPCSDSEVRMCAKEMIIALQRLEHSSLQAVKKKYASEKYLEVAKISVKL